MTEREWFFNFIRSSDRVQCFIYKDTAMLASGVGADDSEAILNAALQLNGSPQYQSVFRYFCVPGLHDDSGRPRKGWRMVRARSVGATGSWVFDPASPATVLCCSEHRPVGYSDAS